MTNAGRVAWIALAVALLALAANAYLVVRLREAEAALRPFRPFLAELLSSDGRLRSEVRIPAGTPINLDIPIDETVRIAVDTIIPLNTRVIVPLRSPLGSYDVPVPIRARIPVRAVIPLRIRETFEVRTETSEEIVVPIEVGG